MHKYVAQRAIQLLKSDNVIDALQLYNQYGIPPINQNFNLYEHLAESVLNSKETHSEYSYISMLRNILLKLVKSLDSGTPVSILQQ